LTSLKIDGKTILYGIIGQSLAHSFSPAMQTRAMQEAGLNAVYLPFPIDQQKLPRLLEAFELIGLRGFNVTLPYKEAIVPWLDGLSGAAAVLQSVNTVKRTPQGWVGYSTDGPGLVQALRESGITLTNRRVLLAGAGGAARAIAYALAEQKVAVLDLLNRTLSKAQVLVALLAPLFPELSLQAGPRSGTDYDLLINATSVGMDGESCPVADDLLQHCRFVLDIIYQPSETPLLSKARQYGLGAENGLGMLLHQGAIAFEIWLEKPAPISSMRESLINALTAANPPQT